MRYGDKATNYRISSGIDPMGADMTKERNPYYPFTKKECEVINSWNDVETTPTRTFLYSSSGPRQAENGLWGFDLSANPISKDCQVVEPDWWNEFKSAFPSPNCNDRFKVNLELPFSVLTTDYGHPMRA